MGYGVAGLLTVSSAGASLMSGFVGFRFFQADGRLEYRFQNLAPDEESRLVGLAFGSAMLIGNTIAGDVVSVTLSGGPLSSPVTISVMAGATDTPLSLARALAAAAMLNVTLTAAKFQAVAPYGTGPYAQNAIPVPEVAFTNPQNFTMTATGTGQTGIAVNLDGGQPLNPALSIRVMGNTTTYYGYLSILDQLENAVGGATQNLDTLKADVWTARNDEVEQRERLYQNWRVRLSHYLGVQLFEETPEGRAYYGGSGMLRAIA